MEKDTAQDQARAQVESIVSMVAALDVDYDRLEELREARDADSENRTPEEWATYYPDDAAELRELEVAAGDCSDSDDARERIERDALSVEVRSDWVAPGEDLTPSEFRIVLCTGGPHVEIVGDLNQHHEPCSVRVLYKDWGTSGELFDFDHAAVLRYCSVFYFGE